jgi:hypothetical protein
VYALALIDAIIAKPKPFAWGKTGPVAGLSRRGKPPMKARNAGKNPRFPKVDLVPASDKEY